MIRCLPSLADGADGRRTARPDPIGRSIRVRKYRVVRSAGASPGETIASADRVESEDPDCPSNKGEHR
jgi:hypothetical protein